MSFFTALSPEEHLSENNWQAEAMVPRQPSAGLMPRQFGISERGDGSKRPVWLLRFRPERIAR
jgi:hypothetical protein